ncbi:flagellar associated protein [Carpediemonas membranifera]|uniref:Flagellar associated protein n=1 Tax=Carpediemonas membranifera TaxID=201153 RepID=A0A8J6AYH2_9EUKA|nr:flagellar associated protein [Carpediemonas membranifera]|eukprot:KAG9394560.1 flagellar associated protein [Carpediemonas membranifera]
MNIRIGHGPCMLKSFTILSHNFMISSSIDIFVGCEREPNSDLDSIRFNRLGSVRMLTNQQSGYRHAPRKTLSIQKAVRVSHVRFVFHEPHPISPSASDIANTFNQVGVLGLEFKGERGASPPRPTRVPDEVRAMQQAPRPQSVSVKLQQDELGMRAKMSLMVKRLQVKKQQAVEEEDYMAAEALKQIITRITGYENSVLDLYERKRLAVQNEDYAAAARTKAELDQITAFLSMPEDELIKALGPRQQAPVEQAPVRQPQLQPREQPRAQPQSQHQPQFDDERPINPMPTQPAREEREAERIRSPSPPSRAASRMADNRDVLPNEGSPERPGRQHITERPPMRARPQSRALQGRTDGRYSGMPETEEQDKEVAGESALGDDERAVTPIRRHLLEDADAMIAVFGEQAVASLTSSKSATRIDGCGRVLNTLLAGTANVNAVSKDGLLKVILAIVQMIVNDNSLGVSSKADIVLQAGLPLTEPHADGAALSTRLLDLLVGKCTSRQAKTVATATHCLELIAQSFGAKEVVRALTRFKSTDAVAMTHAMAALAQLCHAVGLSSKDKMGVDPADIKAAVVAGLKASSTQLRAAAIDVLSLVAPTPGGEEYVTSAVGGITSKLVLTAIMAKLNATPGVDVVYEVIARAGDGKSFQLVPTAPADQAEDTDAGDTVSCQFCGWEGSGGQTELYSHLMDACPLCCRCPVCQKIVEIPCLNDHLATECTENVGPSGDGSDAPYQQCPKCQQIHALEGIEEHIEGCATELKEHEFACPLCLAVMDEEQIYDHYLRSPTCAKNPRRPD